MDVPLLEKKKKKSDHFLVIPLSVECCKTFFFAFFNATFPWAQQQKVKFKAVAVRSWYVAFLPWPQRHLVSYLPPRNWWVP